MDKEIKDLIQETNKLGKESIDVKQGKSQQDGVISSLELTKEESIKYFKLEKNKQDEEISSLKSKMEKKISDLEKDKSKQDSVISSLKSTMKGEIDDLKQEKSKHDIEILSLKSTMEKEISDLKQDKSKQDDEIYSLKSTTEENINDLKQEKSKQDEEISSLKSKLEREINDMKEEKSKQDGVISYLMSTLSINQTYQVQPANDVIVRVDSDVFDSVISGMCQMSDGTVLLLDLSNDKLKRLDDKFNVEDFYQFKMTPLSVVPVSSSQVVVLSESGKLIYLTIKDKIVHEKYVALEEVKDPNGMIYCKDQFWISCKDGIYVYSLSGSLVKRIRNDRLHSRSYEARIMATNEEKTRVYIVNDIAVKVLDPDGEIMCFFQVRNYAYALTVTADGNLLVVEFESKNVVVYDTEGKNLGVLISGTSLLSRPLSLLHDGKKNCLIVGFGESSMVQVFQLNK